MATVMASYTTGHSALNSSTALDDDRWQQQPHHWQPVSNTGEHLYSTQSTQPRIDLGYVASLDNSEKAFGLTQDRAKAFTMRNVEAFQQNGSSDGLYETASMSIHNSRAPALPNGGPTEDTNSKWIHRDKLAQIESQELAEIGIQLDFTDRIIGQASNKPNVSPTPTQLEPNASISSTEHLSHDPLLPDAKRPRKATLSEHDSEGARAQIPTSANLPSTSATPRVMKPGFSRIPVSKSSPLSKPPAAMNLESSSTPARKGSIKNARNSLEWTGNSKSRNPSIGGDESSHGNSRKTLDLIPLKPASPSRLESLSISKPRTRSASDSRRLPNGSQAPGQGRYRNASAPLKTLSPARPATSGGPRQTANRLEGDAPWIATMFKPDPMLPQEQQIIPTHAKRMAIEHGQVVPVVEPFDHVPPVSTKHNYSNVLEGPDVTRQSLENTDAELTARSRSSLRNRFRRDTSISENSIDYPMPTDIGESSNPIQQHLEESDIIDQQTDTSYVVQQNTSKSSSVDPRAQEGEEWPLRQSSKTSEEQHSPAIQIPKDYLPGHDIKPYSSERLTMSDDHQVEPPQPLLLVAPNPESTAISAPPKTTRMPQVPIQEQKEKSCGCCIVM